MVQQAFPKGLEVTFPVSGLTRRAVVVRVSPYEEGLLSLGCRFEEYLSESEAAVLDVAAAQVEEPEAALDVLPWHTKPEYPLSLLLFVGGDDVAGPLHLGQLIGAGDRVIEAQLFAQAEGALSVARSLEVAPLGRISAPDRLARDRKVRLF